MCFTMLVLFYAAVKTVKTVSEQDTLLKGIWNLFNCERDVSGESWIFNEHIFLFLNCYAAAITASIAPEK